MPIPQRTHHSSGLGHQDTAASTASELADSSSRKRPKLGPPPSATTGYHTTYFHCMHSTHTSMAQPFNTVCVYRMNLKYALHWHSHILVHSMLCQHTHTNICTLKPFEDSELMGLKVDIAAVTPILKGTNTPHTALT